MLDPMTTMTSFMDDPFAQWFPNFSGAWTTKNILVLLEAKNIDLY
jgi:hypothetical protein